MSSDVELAEMVASALAQAGEQDQRDREREEYERLNGEAVRLHRLGYRYPPPSQRSPAADAEAEQLVERARDLAERARGRTANVVELLEWAVDLQHEWQRLIFDWLVREDLVVEMNALLGGLAERLPARP